MGKTPIPQILSHPFADHPHTHGENFYCHQIFFQYKGPSPHAWGKRSLPTSFPCFKWTIPTRMGKTCHLFEKILEAPDHPHTHGENFFDSEDNVKIFGPSPHAWGKQRLQDLNKYEMRTIPTRMGKTHECRCRLVLLSDHPHTHGENTTKEKVMKRIIGPSPHAWGKHQRNKLVQVFFRTIPTRMGKT